MSFGDGARKSNRAHGGMSEIIISLQRRPRNNESTGVSFRAAFIVAVIYSRRIVMLARAMWHLTIDKNNMAAT